MLRNICCPGFLADISAGKLPFRAEPASGGQSGRWALYDLAQDPAEMHDLSGQRPEIYQRLLASWEKYVNDNNVILLDDTNSQR